MVLLEYQTQEKEIPELTDYNPLLARFDSDRLIWIPDNGWIVDYWDRYLLRYPQACIYNKISHEPIGDIIILNGEPFIDAFGLHVYIQSNLAWTARSDVDLRFNANQFPYHILEPDLGFMFR